MSRSTLVVVALVLNVAPAQAHDLGADVFVNGTTASANNPRSGSLGVSLSGSYDFNDRWTAFLSGVYLRDFATRASEAFSPGSNIFFLSGGAMFLPSDHWMFVATVMGSPTTVQRNASPIEVDANTVDVVVRGTNASVGGSLLASYATNGLSKLEHSIDVSVGLNHFRTQQQFELPTTTRVSVIRAYCTRNPESGYCPLVNGLDDALTQVRLAATYVATVSRKTDLGLDVAGFLYDTADPLSVGVFSAVSLGRQGPDLGSGVPVAPWLFTARAHVTHRFSKVSLRGAYQLGVYTSEVGTNHLLSARVTWKVTDVIRLTFSLLVQTDVYRRQVVNRGGTATIGTLVVF